MIIVRDLKKSGEPLQEWKLPHLTINELEDIAYNCENLFLTFLGIIYSVNSKWKLTSSVETAF